MGVRLPPSSSASLFNYLKSKAVSLQVCENPVSLAAAWCSDILRGQPCLSTSVRLAPAWVPFSCRHCAEEGLARDLRSLPGLSVSLLSPVGLHDTLDFFFNQMGLKIWLFHSTLWLCYETMSLSTATDINQWSNGLG